MGEVILRGFLINLAVFVLSKLFKRSDKSSLKLCFLSFAAVFLSSLIIGSWLGLTILIMSLGMLIFALFASIVLFILKRKR